MRAADAFVPYPPVAVAHAAAGPLAGLRFAVKDLFDVAGYPTGCGSPAMTAAASPAARHAATVARLLDAGAAFAGKTQTDEFAWSLLGANPGMGTPTNPAAPDRLPGGSSSGSASAVAAGSVDFAIGTDTGGSIRAPASFCGLWGLRPTHGRVSLEGAMPLAPGFDTCGWFARDAATFARVAEVLLGAPIRPPAAPRVIVASDMRARAIPAVQAAIDRAADALGAGDRRDIYPVPVADLVRAFVVLQSHEAGASLAAPIARYGPPADPAVAARVTAARALDPAEVAQAAATRAMLTRHLADLLGPDDVLLVPAVPGEAPPRAIAGAEADAVRADMLALLCVAGLAARPQLAVPAGRGPGGAPIAVSLIGAPGSDAALITLGARLAIDAMPTSPLASREKPLL